MVACVILQGNSRRALACRLPAFTTADLECEELEQRAVLWVQDLGQPEAQRLEVDWVDGPVRLAIENVAPRGWGKGDC